MGAEGAIRSSTSNKPIWEVWASEPLTKEAALVVKWSRTSFFVGCPVVAPKIIDGKEFFLYHKCSDEAWARQRVEHARQYFQEVRLTLNGSDIKLEPPKEPPTPPKDDMLGAYSTLGVKGGSC